MKWIALLIVAGFIGCAPGSRMNVVAPSQNIVSAPEWDGVATTEDDGLIARPIIPGKTDLTFKKTLLYKYKKGKPSQAMYYFPLYVVE